MCHVFTLYPSNSHSVICRLRLSKAGKITGVARNGKWCSCYAKHSGDSSTNLIRNYRMIQQCHVWEEAQKNENRFSESYLSTCVRTASVITARRGEQPECPSANDQMNKMVHCCNGIELSPSKEGSSDVRCNMEKSPRLYGTMNVA